MSDPSHSMDKIGQFSDGAPVASSLIELKLNFAWIWHHAKVNCWNSIRRAGPQCGSHTRPLICTPYYKAYKGRPRKGCPSPSTSGCAVPGGSQRPGLPPPVHHLPPPVCGPRLIPTTGLGSTFSSQIGEDNTNTQISQHLSVLKQSFSSNIHNHMLGVSIRKAFNSQNTSPLFGPVMDPANFQPIFESSEVQI